ncbi:MAG: T9SS type A sorting domain-containing protein [Calditrichaeota bacterium]|nr:T9SS type A sorting domain-containing protein [Calditrichota bacterium]
MMQQQSSNLHSVRLNRGIMFILLALFSFNIVQLRADDLELEGVIEAIGPDSLSVSSITVFVDSDTEVRGPNGPIGFSTLRAGHYVEVRADLQNNGVYLANRIELFGDVDFEGNIQALGSDSLSVNGLAAQVDANTEIRGPSGSILAFSDLQIGDRVELQADLQPNGGYLATRIEVETSGNRLEIEGFVDAKGAASIEVNSITLFVGSGTEIRGPHGSPLTFGDIQVGDQVEVRAFLRPDSSYLATRIKVESEGRQIEISGFIDALGTDSLTVGGFILTINSATELRGRNGEPITFSNLQLGDLVEVKALQRPDSSYLATRIRLRNNSSSEVELTAPIDSLFGDTVAVAGLHFGTDAATEILDDQGLPIAFGDLLVGMIVEIRGLRQPDSSLYATRIKVEDYFQDEVEVTGTIDSLGTDFLVVASLHFNVDAGTMVLDHQNLPIAFSDLTLGALVEVRAIRQVAGGPLRAERIKIEDPAGNEIELYAVIDSLGITSLYAAGSAFGVDANTLILNHANNPITFSDLAAGMLVEIKALIEPDSSFRAVRIKIENSPNFSVISGQIISLSPGQIVVSQPAYQLTVATVVLNRHFEVISASDLAVGETITLWASGTAGQPAALQIRQQGAGNLTSIAPVTSAGLPGDYELAQNYPNPFNPATTIPLTIRSAGVHRVEIRVYNLLGQSVRTIFSGFLDSGSYRFQWDGHNNDNHPAASGMYIYRLTVDGKPVSARRMLLLK